ncbi:uncharacterized protein METZ01_LOCUS234331 [marine metagenome]|uniref:Uncharacterized protein n=1 Tax=marine metagenome TaxID=408172 RepID=A0A382H3I4_9ZZZZ
MVFLNKSGGKSDCLFKGFLIETLKEVTTTVAKNFWLKEGDTWDSR